MRTILRAFLVATVAVVGACGAGSPPGTSRTVPATPSSSSVDAPVAPSPPAADALVLLESLRIEAEGPMSGYSRAKFPHWDEDEQRCSTRERVLIEESRTPAQVDPYGCKVLSGDWLSLYDDVATDDPTAIEIDHFVPLAEAYRSGARDWDDARRRAFANDLQHPQALIAVTASSNRSKSDSDPAGWRPIRSYWCQYAIDWVVVKTAWDLSADAPEVDALLDMFATCTSVPAGPTAPPTAPAPTTRPATPTPPPTVPPSTTPPMPTTVVAPPSTAAGQCHPSYPTLCLPVDGPDVDCSDLQARNFRVLPPDPYRLDGNGDGIGCQS